MPEHDALCVDDSCWAQTGDELYESLGSSAQGLTSEEAAKRLEEYGRNEIREIKGRPLILKFLENFYHLFAIMLWIGGILAFVGGMPELGLGDLRGHLHQRRSSRSGRSTAPRRPPTPSSR